MKKDTTRVCKSKNCSRPLPEGYKYKYCESCRNGQVETIKKVFKGIGAVAGTVLTIVVAISPKGKNK